MSWREFFNSHADTLAIALGFAVAGSGFALWLGDRQRPITRGQALGAVMSAIMVACIATAFVQGYLKWSIFIAPFVGALCGLVSLPVIRAIIKGGRRVEMRADDIADKGIDLLPGRKDDK